MKALNLTCWLGAALLAAVYISVLLGLLIVIGGWILGGSRHEHSH